MGGAEGPSIPPAGTRAFSQVNPLSSCNLTVLPGSTFCSCNPLVTAEEERRRREITGLLLHRDVRQVRPVAGGGCGRVLAPVRETHGLGGRLGRLDQVGWPRARTTLRPRSRILLLLLSTRQPRPPLIILQLLQQEHGACIGPPIVLLLQSANCSQSRACCPSSELKVMQDASSHSASK